AKEGMLGGEKHRPAFACADVEENGALDGRERMKLLQPEIEQCANDARCDAVVGSEVVGLVCGAARDDGPGNKARGICAMCSVQGVNGRFARRHGQGRPASRMGKSAGSMSISVREMS